jgi:hypothetical protein
MSFSDWQSFTDTHGGSELYNPASHQALSPLQCAIQLATKETAELPGYLPIGIWYTLKHDLGLFKTNYSFVDGFNPAVIPNPSLPGIDWTTIVNTVGDQLDGHMSADSNILVTLAESAKTIQMVKEPFRLLKHDWRKTSKRLSASVLAKGGANVWLSWRYGWMQLYRDVVAFATIKRRIQEHINFLSQTRGSWQSLAKSQVDYGTCSPIQGSPNVGFWLEPSINVVRRATFSLDIFRSEQATRFTNFELFLQASGAYDILFALWDLVPFSFIVDWFVDIGNWISSGPIYWNRFKLRKMGYSVKTTYNCKLRVGSIAANWQGSTEPVYHDAPEYVGYKTYYRTPGFPPDTSGVGLFGGLNLTHLADSAAIIAQRM